jgi:hypothetical protein
VKIRLIAWALFASVEFGVTILIAAVLYLGGTLYFAARMYVTALDGSLKRVIILWHARVDLAKQKWGKSNSKVSVCENAANLKKHGSPDVGSACGPVGRGRFDAWLN